MISFACKHIDLRDIIQCSFDLSKTDYRLLIFLLHSEPLSISQISSSTKLERSTVQKSISRLLKNDLIKRRQINISQGGYRYIYGIDDKEILRARLNKVVEGWYHNVREAISSW